MMNLVNKVVFVVSFIATLIFWIGGVVLIGEIRHTLLDPQVGWGGLYLNLFKFIALPMSIALAALSMIDSDDVVASIKGYIWAIILGFFLTIPLTLVWLLFMASLGFLGFSIAFVAAHGSISFVFFIMMIIVGIVAFLRIN